MTNLGSGEIMAILLIALIVLGPERLPEAARKVGKVIRQVKAMSAGFEQEVRKAIDVDGLNPFAEDPSRGDTPFHPEQARLSGVAPPDTEPVAELTDEIRARNDAPIPTTAIESVAPPDTEPIASSPIAAEPPGDDLDPPVPGEYPAAS